MDRVLRRSLGVSETAPTDTTVKPAPEVDPVVLDESHYEPPKAAWAGAFDDLPEWKDGKPRVLLSDEMKEKIEIDIEEMDDDAQPVHDEL